MTSNALFETIAALLRQRWSPRQIAARLAKLHSSDASMRVSHETIYNVIYAQPRGELQARADCLPAHGQSQTLASLAR